mgnify:CR=1 FL=1
MVLPFKWRDFGAWFSRNSSVRSENEHGILKIADLCFASSHHNLNGIRIGVELKLLRPDFKNVFLCAFLADMGQMQLFEPFVGNPDSGDNNFFASLKVALAPDKTGNYELFLPEAGWVLPSIWRFLVQSLGLRPKGHARMPDVITFAFEPGDMRPLLFAAKPFDYYGSAQRLKEEVMLDDFFQFLNLTPDASEAEIQRAYILSCRDFKASQSENVDSEETRSVSTILTASSRVIRSGRKNSSRNGFAEELRC